MSFKFDFDIDEENGGSVSCNQIKENLVKNKAGIFDDAVKVLAPAKLIQADVKTLKHLLNENRIKECRKEHLKIRDGLELRYVAATDVNKELEQDYETSVVNSHSDLIPAVYEGGFQIWECTFDLIEFLSQQNTDWSALRVLELGCGAGLPGCFTLSCGAAVDFQDFNEEVLTRTTMPNAALNVHNNFSSKVSLNFYSGDWSEVEKLICEDINSDNTRKYFNPLWTTVTTNILTRIQYDMILASETIYSVRSYDKLHSLINSVLKPGGVVYMAAKTFYFGVGGGTRDFESFVKSKAFLACSSLKQITDGGVHREILEMKHLH